jgi:hypothetical protein
MTALPDGADMPTLALRVNNSGIAVHAIPIVAAICIVVKMSVVALVAASMDSRVATLPIAVPEMPVAIMYAVAAAVVARRLFANRSTIVALPTETAVVIPFALVDAVRVVVASMDAAPILDHFAGPVKIVVDPTFSVTAMEDIVDIKKLFKICYIS